ncbi:hypothetical protein GCK72_020242 [Caenorhabditis remanei]|uniref:SCP domain-containing protein n=1 Tax=Caenorhabditis remanei TaxID=31234 RepID=E3LI49_CAERE|nr:hypothetical protein GCK72_020242 [Caenorhabditis remanei]EFO95173.1 hypothetical protein CRE_08889 [Caenorhabditis remanei]KAF1753685.1 hypothetical protein GCK72_020242 [Caenorhabditis remanei]
MQLLLLCFALFGASYAQFSAAAQADILKAHNSLRSAFAKGTFSAQGVPQLSAANMVKMKWSSRMAASSQAYANSCPDGNSGTDDIGENLFQTWEQVKPTDLNQYGKKAALAWQDEFNQFGISSNLLDQDALDSGIGDATQMIWATTGFVGCGVKNCGPDQDRFDQAFKIVVVCQYMEKGNVVDENIYEVGDTCSACGDFTACEESSGLCV